jgi:hypothetical protein
VLPRVSVLSLPDLRRLQGPGPVTGLSLVLKLVNPVYGKVTVDMLPEHVARAHLETNGKMKPSGRGTGRGNAGIWVFGVDSCGPFGHLLSCLPMWALDPGSSESLASQPYFRKRLQQCLGDPHAVLLQADLPPSWEEVSNESDIVPRAVWPRLIVCPCGLVCGAGYTCGAGGLRRRVPG